MKQLRTIKPEEFDFGSYYFETDCGTTACAIDHAALMPKFRKLGLRILRQNTVIDMASRKTDYSAGCRIFSLTMAEASHLFLWNCGLTGRSNLSPRIDASAAQVADHIEDFVQWREKNAELAELADAAHSG